MSPPESESLAQLVERCLPVWEKEIMEDLLEGRNVLVVAHGNSIRAIVQESASRATVAHSCLVRVAYAIPLTSLA